MKQVLLDWVKKPLTSINRDMIVNRHIKFGQENSQARANLAMRLLRAIFNFAIHEYQSEDGKSIITVNPVTYLSHVKSWYRVDRRQTIIKQHQLADWYQGLLALSNYYPDDQASLWQDYFLLVLFTGMRRTEAASLEWSNVDLKAKTFTLLDTKNRDSHTLPMSDFIYEIFQRRFTNRVNSYVFPSSSNNKHIVEPRKALLNIIKASEIEFTIHDMRRTFITMAESLDIPAYALKRLLNHKMTNDVTSGYLVMDVERLRKPMQQVTDNLLKYMSVKKSAEVIEITSVSNAVK